MSRSFATALLLGAIILIFRFIPNPDNYTPLLALCLGAGFVSRGRWYGFVIPVLAMLVADIRLGLYAGWAFTYIPLVAVVALGTLSRPKVLTMAGLGLSSSLVFFVVSNFGVWFSTGLYTKNLAGLWTCYVAAIPFFHQTLVSTLVFALLLFTPLFVLENRLGQRVVE